MPFLHLNHLVYGSYFSVSFDQVIAKVISLSIRKAPYQKFGATSNLPMKAHKIAAWMYCKEMVGCKGQIAHDIPRSSIPGLQTRYRKKIQSTVNYRVYQD